MDARNGRNWRRKKSQEEILKDSNKTKYKGGEKVLIDIIVETVVYPKPN